jgi:hypothetical protein
MMAKVHMAFDQIWLGGFREDLKNVKSFKTYNGWTPDAN